MNDREREHSDPIGVRIGALQPASADQALDAAQMHGPDVTSEKQPIPAGRGIVWAAFEMIGIDRHVKIVEEGFERDLCALARKH
jgi:hypothetical protein